jgi:hypothetical protein
MFTPEDGYKKLCSTTARAGDWSKASVVPSAVDGYKYLKYKKLLLR